MAKTPKVITLFVPLILFFIVCIFLFKGLYSDPRKLDSALVGKPVPQFVLQDIYDPNKQHDASVLQGKKMLLNVWATWCPTCYAEHKFLNQLAAQDIYIVGLNYKDERKKAIQWLTDLKDPYKISLFDGNGMLGMDLGVYGAPETYFIDSKGIIQYRHVGDLNARVWDDQLKALFDGMQ